jgi:hypothetical protein
MAKGRLLASGGRLHLHTCMHIAHCALHTRRRTPLNAANQCCTSHYGLMDRHLYGCCPAPLPASTTVYTSRLPPFTFAAVDPAAAASRMQSERAGESCVSCTPESNTYCTPTVDALFLVHLRVLPPAVALSVPVPVPACLAANPCLRFAAHKRAKSTLTVLESRVSDRGPLHPFS